MDNGLLDFLRANTQGMKYLVAVESSQVGAPFVLATGRPVLYMGGFNGGDDVVSAEDLDADSGGRRVAFCSVWGGWEKQQAGCNSVVAEFVQGGGTVQSAGFVPIRRARTRVGRFCTTANKFSPRLFQEDGGFFAMFKSQRAGFSQIHHREWPDYRKNLARDCNHCR